MAEVLISFVCITYKDVRKKLSANTCGRFVRRDSMKFYTIKLPKFLGGLVRAMIGVFKKE